MTSDKQEEAVVKAYKARMRAVVDRLRADLKVWIHRHNGDDVFGDPPADNASSHNDVPVTLALLETAIDREIHLLGEKDARELVMSAFDRRATALRQRLQ